jgi:hypothetical protein
LRHVGAAEEAAVKETSRLDGMLSEHWLGDPTKLGVTPEPETLKLEVLDPLSEPLQ